MLVLDDEFVKAADMSESELKLELAILLFQKEKVSSRKAAKLSGIDFLDFWHELAKRNINLINERTYVDGSGNLIL
jgi:predicted HTH domain antitoxin